MSQSLNLNMEIVEMWNEIQHQIKIDSKIRIYADNKNKNPTDFFPVV